MFTAWISMWLWSIQLILPFITTVRGVNYFITRPFSWLIFKFKGVAWPLEWQMDCRCLSVLAVCLLLAVTSPQWMFAAELAISAVFVLFFGIISYNLILGYKAHVFGFRRYRSREQPALYFSCFPLWTCTNGCLTISLLFGVFKFKTSINARSFCSHGTDGL